MMIPYHGYEAPTALPHTPYTGHHHHPAQETPEPVPKYTRSIFTVIPVPLTKLKGKLYFSLLNSCYFEQLFSGAKLISFSFFSSPPPASHYISRG